MAGCIRTFINHRFVTFAAVTLIMAIFTGMGTAENFGIEHVVIIGCDGMSPDGVQKADTPVMDRLMQEGAYSFHARAVMPTSSSSNWASMMMGAGPEQHGITSNDWQPDRFEIAPTATGPGGIFPTIFSVIRGQRPDAVTAVFHDWDDFGRLFERDMVTKIVDGDGPDKTIEAAVEYIQEKHPLFAFIHLDHVDHAGHEYGHGTPEYYASVQEADRLIGIVVDTLKEANIYERTLLIVTSDHGGIEKGHGGSTMAEIEIPWIIVGPGVAANKAIETPIDVYDTAATVAYVLDLMPPECWIAQPVLSAFEK